MVLLVCIAISMRCSSMIPDQIAYKPFHNQLRKQGFPLFMRALVERAIALRLKECLPDAHGLAGFEQVLLQDGSSFALHPQLAEHFPGRFNKHSPAAVECHMTMSLLDQSPISMSITADTESERKASSGRKFVK